MTRTIMQIKASVSNVAIYLMAQLATLFAIMNLQKKHLFGRSEARGRLAFSCFVVDQDTRAL